MVASNVATAADTSKQQALSANILSRQVESDATSVTPTNTTFLLTNSLRVMSPLLANMLTTPSNMPLSTRTVPPSRRERPFRRQLVRHTRMITTLTGVETGRSGEEVCFSCFCTSSQCLYQMWTEVVAEG